MEYARGEHQKQQEDRKSLRWVDDVIHAVDCGRDNWKKYVVPNFYHDKCILEPGDDDTFAGVTVQIRENRIMGRAATPNMKGLTTDKILNMYRLAHGKGFESGRKQKARVESLICRTVDLCSKAAGLSRLHELVRFQVLECEYFGIPKNNINEALLRFHSKYPKLDLKACVRDYLLPDFQHNVLEACKGILDEEELSVQISKERLLSTGLTL